MADMSIRRTGAMAVMKFIKLSQQHLRETGWSYRQHLAHSLRQSSKLLQILFKSLVHGVLPWIYKSDAPRGVFLMYKEIRKMDHVQKIFDELDRG